MTERPAVSEPGHDSGSLRVTIKDVFAGVNDIKEQMGEMKGGIQQLSSATSENTKDIVDHESRIRMLEAWRYALPASALLGALGVVGSMIAVVAK